MECTNNPNTQKMSWNSADHSAETSGLHQSLLKFGSGPSSHRVCPPMQPTTRRKSPQMFCHDWLISIGSWVLIEMKDWKKEKVFLLFGCAANSSSQRATIFKQCHQWSACDRLLCFPLACTQNKMAHVDGELTTPFLLLRTFSGLLKSEYTALNPIWNAANVTLHIYLSLTNLA